MTRECPPIYADTSGAAAAEMALVLPILLLIMFSSLELGNYFMNEHRLAEAVRNGARFAARQDFTNYTACTGSLADPARANTRNVVMRGYLTGGTVITPNIQATNISVTTYCKTNAGTETMGGIYAGRPDGAQIVSVAATVNYRPLLSSFGFTGIGFRLNATSEAAVSGL